MIRGFVNYGYICGYVPIDFESPLENGSTRKKKYEKINEIYKKLRIEQQNSDIINSYKKTWKKIKPQTYDLSGFSE